MIHYAKQMCWESEEKLHAFLILPLDGDEFSALYSSCMVSAKTVPEWVRGWWILESGLDALVKSQISFPAGNRISVSQLSSQ